MKPVGKVVATIRPGQTPVIATAVTGPAPARPDTMTAWLMLFSKTRMSGKPVSPAELHEQIEDLMFVCRDLPAECWSEEALRQAKGHFEWWPGPAQLRKFLEPFGDVAWIHHRMATAPRIESVRESTTTYKLPPPPPNLGQPRVVSDEDIGRPDLNIQPPAMSPDDQIRAMGLDPDEVRRKMAEKAEKP